MAERFTWRPMDDAQGAVNFRTLTAQFGDGYEQSVADGINNKVQSWPLQFGPDRSTVIAVAAFLDRHGGARSFLWTPPLGIEAYFKVTSYTPAANRGGIYLLSATFQQVFRPA